MNSFSRQNFRALWPHLFSRYYTQDMSAEMILSSPSSLLSNQLLEDSFVFSHKYKCLFNSYIVHITHLDDALKSACATNLSTFTEETGPSFPGLLCLPTH